MLRRIYLRGRRSPPTHQRAELSSSMTPPCFRIDSTACELCRDAAERALIRDSISYPHQYFGTLWSISSDHALMPPLTLFTYLNPCSRRNLSAFMERMPLLQWM